VEPIVARAATKDDWRNESDGVPDLAPVAMSPSGFLLADWAGSQKGPVSLCDGARIFMHAAASGKAGGVIRHCRKVKANR
jgi:hypothetical protein